MKPHPNHPLRALTTLAGLAMIALSQLVAQTAPAPAPATPPPDEEALVLSPFTVEAGSEKGYLATQTLNGTRLRTDLKDIGSSLTIFTEQLMDDIGATSITDLMAFAPNTDPFIASTADVAGNGNDFINVGNQQYVTRGGATAVISQDFFGTNVPNDRFNTESLTFTRGPNAILFGLGNASGAFVSSSKRAKFKTATTVAYQVDHRGSYRATLDHNQVLKPGLLAVRYSGLYESRNTFRPPTEDLQRRHFATLTFTPFKKTTLRVNYERGDVNVPAVRPWPVYDAVSPWIAAGSPIIPRFTNTATGKPAGTINYTSPGLVSTQFSVGGVQIPPQSLNNSAQSAKPAFPNFPVNGTNFRSLVNDSIYPTFASNFGSTAFRLHDYRTFSAFLEQQVTRDLFLEVAFNQLDNRLIALNGLVGQTDFLYVDPNGQLPNGAANPNVGKLYSETSPTRIDSPTKTENVRVTASYTFDFGRLKGRWLQHLGRHQAALFGEQSHSEGWTSNNAIRNVTPFAATGSAALITNGANSLTFRYYVEPEKGAIGMGAGGRYLDFPVLYSGVTPPPGAGTGIITPGFVAQQGLNMSAGIVKTRALATQSFFWKNRLVITHGLRTDDNTSWRGTPTDFVALRDAHGIAPSGNGIDLRKTLPGARRERGGRTFTRGVVFHATDWLSFTYNTSTNFQVNDSRLNVYGDILPNPEGEGQDYGVKLSLLRGKVFVELTHYTTRNLNAVDQISSNAAGDFGGPLNRMWQAIADFTRDTKYDTYPFNAQGTTWQDAVSTTSKGYEFSVTANPTPRWRVTLNGSKRGDNTTTDRGPFITAYLAEYLPFIKSHPEWQGVITTPGNVPVAQVVANLESTLENFKKIRGSPSANFASDWTLNLIQSYDLGGRFKGFSVGGSMNARGKAIGGFQVDANNLLDVTKPYHTPAYANFGAWLTYKRRILRDRVNWTMQLNVRNVLDENTVYPLFIVDRRDGTHRPDTAVYTLKEPRTYLFTSTFRF